MHSPLLFMDKALGMIKFFPKITNLTQMKQYILTKYECARIVGIRSSQLSMNAPVQVNVPEHLKANLMYIAAKELKEKKLDIVVKRPLPDNKFYQIHINDMEIPEDLHFLEEMLNVNLK
jgi:DNA-directed RNA polymerase subunit K/omega